MKKVCSKCKKEKSINDFNNRKNSSGKIIKNSVCRECLKIKAQKYREKSKEKLSEYNKKRYVINREKIRQNQREWYKNSESVKKWNEKNKEKLKVYRKQYYINNREKILKQNRKNSDKRKLIDPLYKLKYGIRTMIGRAIRLRGYTKRSQTQSILGCTFEEFKIYLEGKFEGWMNWNNHGKYNGKFNYGWDIDHIIPLSSAKTEDELLKLNHYTNLQPLCSKINRDIKREKF